MPGRLSPRGVLVDGDEVPYRGDERLRKAERLLTGRDYRIARRGSQRYVTANIVVLASRGQQPWTRIGITASRKVGPAHERNRVKRRLRDIFRRNKLRLPAGLDVVWIVRTAATSASYEALRRDAAEGTEAAARKLNRRDDGARSRRRRRGNASNNV